MTSEIELFEVVCPADYQPSELEQAHHESMQDRIVRVTRDYADLQSYYDIGISPTRSSKLSTFFRDEYKDLLSQAFELYSEEEKIDYILLKNYLRRNLSELQLIDESNKKMDVVLPFAPTLVRLCENKRDMKSLDPQEAAKDVYELGIVLESVERDILGGKIKVQKATAYRAANMLANLQKKIQGWFLFYDGYDPSFTWWVGEPFKTTNSMIDSVIVSIRQTLVGISPDDNDAIVGQPIGREGLLAALDAEMIAYTPEQIIKIGHSEYAWCESEMKKAAQELGFENDWRAALEHVKNTYVEPGKQPQLIFDLAHEAIEFVAKYDLVTVPLIASQQWRMFMMSPEEQKTNPFFLGGNDIQVSYPTNTMGHKDKLMSMRGNNPHFARSTVFHEVIPGHKLQYYSLMRYKPYRAAIGNTPFWIEGWAFYWEMVLWNDPNFVKTAEDRIGMLFWRMHRCARIIFSLSFHLGKMSPQESIDFLVNKVGFERANAEGEVRRSFNGDYGPLYQAAYMLGALQFWRLREEFVASGRLKEKSFHDSILKGNMMPVELVRAMLGKGELREDFKAVWKFYEKV